MKRLFVLSLVILLTACSSISGDKGALSSEELAAQEAARQEEMRRQEEARQEELRRQEEVRRQEEEARRQEAAKLEEEQWREAERIAAEERRQEQMRLQEEERRQEEARLQEELRRQEEARQMEILRQQRLEDGDDPSLVGMVTKEQLREADPILLEQSVFFDFDRYEIDPKYASLIAAHARFLIVNPTVKIFVEGNCDDRGSPEYNISLGQRRSDAIQRALLALGVPSRQIEAVSYGAERPVAYGATEEAWAQNRRADIAYPMFDY
ncbi:MAG: peptidoglycan-associated lipoprotein Pal [Betaproteobacteria bacterium]|nr:MAG: peptidoglycan-associated lipoprotein Pal [Betaproteobacteria bacterium]